MSESAANLVLDIFQDMNQGNCNEDELNTYFSLFFVSSIVPPSTNLRISTQL